MFAGPASTNTAAIAVLHAAGWIASSTDQHQLAERLAAVLPRITHGCVSVVCLGGSVRSGLACNGTDAVIASEVAALVAASSELHAAVTAEVPVPIGRHDGPAAAAILAALDVSSALVAGIDDGSDQPGLLLVAGDGMAVEDDAPALRALIELAAPVAAHLNRVARRSAAAERDPATGLLTLAGLERAADEMANAPGTRIGIVVLQLDGVPELSAAFGACAGRLAQRELAERLRRVPGAVAVAAPTPERLAVLVQGDEIAVGDQLIACAAGAVSVGRYAVEFRVHAGAAGGPGRSGTARVLIERAELARVEASRQGVPIVVHSDALAEGCHRRMEMAVQLRRALDRDELVVHYQPQVAGDGRLLAVEALVRWAREDGELVAPDVFLPVAERAGLMADIDLYVLRAACRQLQTWEAEGFSGFRMAVNLSASTLSRPGLAAAVLGAVRDAQVDPARIELEITETAANDDGDWGPVLCALRAEGLTVAIDDFGTGFSSLARIHRLPIDRLKIDRCFVDDLRGAGRTVVTSVVALAKGLGLDVLAEGVEDEWQLDALRELGCEEFQGYLFSRPLSATELYTRQAPACR